MDAYQAGVLVVLDNVRVAGMRIDADPERNDERADPELPHKHAGGSEDLDALIELITHVEVPVGTNYDVEGVIELVVITSPRTPCRDEHAVARELLDAMVAHIRDVDEVVVCGDAGSAGELTDVMAVTAPPQDERSARRELPDIPRQVDHVDVAGGIDGDAVRKHELGVAGDARPQRPNVRGSAFGLTRFRQEQDGRQQNDKQIGKVLAHATPPEDEVNNRTDTRVDPVQARDSTFETYTILRICQLFKHFLNINHNAVKRVWPITQLKHRDYLSAKYYYFFYVRK